ncbi:DNA-binding transcriptional LysR family regulator [Bosea sp. OAE506]|uniref:LysR family transcriptional regulator n=1 Tax=Bosea sp. OAE506 TaxID=2663870 RepID=UPI001789BADF
MGPAASAASRRDGDLAAPGWDDIGIFHAIAESGSLALAAVRLGLSEATTARRLKAFERRLGLLLFRRGANRLIPTEAGAALAREAEGVATAVARFASRARAARPEASAPVRVTATTSISLFLTKHAGTISAGAGGVEIVIISTRQRLDLARGDADIAVRMSRIPEEPGHYGQKVGRLVQALYVRRDVDPEAAPIISVSRETSSRIDEHIIAYAAGRPIAARVGDSAARYESVRSAGAVSMVPCFMGDADPLLRRLAPPPDLTADEIFLVTHEVSRQRPAVVAVLAALRKLFRDHRAGLEGQVPPTK